MYCSVSPSTAPRAGAGVKLFAHLPLISSSESETAPRGLESKLCSQHHFERAAASVQFASQPVTSEYFPKFAFDKEKEFCAVAQTLCLRRSLRARSLAPSAAANLRDMSDTPRGKSPALLTHIPCARSTARCCRERHQQPAVTAAAAEPLCNSGVELCCTHYKPDQLLGRRHSGSVTRSHTHTQR